MLHLCKRLQAVMNLVPQGVPVADIGCDHGRLACALLQRGAPWITAVDISALSLDKARRLAETLSVGDRMIARQGDGLEGLEPGIGAVVIAGLSAHTIRDILRRRLDTARAVGCFMKTDATIPCCGQCRAAPFIRRMSWILALSCWRRIIPCCRSISCGRCA